MGGGTVGFPILVMLLHEVPQLGRDFSFCIQSIGMTSASIFLFCRRDQIDRQVLVWSCAGSLIGTPLGILFIEPLISGLWIKLLFSILWASFGAFTIIKIGQISVPTKLIGMAQPIRNCDRVLPFVIGLIGGGTVAAITGVGIDMFVYLYLILIKRTDLRIAIPTSVVIMAFTSLVGVATLSLKGHSLAPVFPFWLAAAPIVALGAPLGSFVVQMIGRGITLFVVSLLCIVQLGWLCVQEFESLQAIHWIAVILGTFLGVGVCIYLLTHGQQNHDAILVRHCD